MKRHRLGAVVDRPTRTGLFVGVIGYMIVYGYMLYAPGPDALILLAYLGMPLTIGYSFISVLFERFLSDESRITVDWVAILILGLIQYGGIGYLLGKWLSAIMRDRTVHAE